MSIGVTRTKHLAKIASQVAKPDRLVIVDPEISRVPSQTAVALMWGVGPATEARLAKNGVTTIGRWRRASSIRGTIASTRVGKKLTALRGTTICGESRCAGGRRPPRRTIGTSTRPCDEPVFNRRCIIADRIGPRLRARSLAGRTITVRVRFRRFALRHALAHASAPISATRALAEIRRGPRARRPCGYRDEKTISLLAIAVSKI